MLVYLDQNHASRIAKFLRGQPSHDHFGALYAALRAVRPCVPPSPFHVLETRGGYLLPTLRGLFDEFSGGRWVRPYQEVVLRQAASGGVRAGDLLTGCGDWETAARLEPLHDLLELPLQGSFRERARRVRAAAADRFGLEAAIAHRLPFFGLLGRTTAFRSLDRERIGRGSDLADLLMVATVAPYVDVLATDRYVRELLERTGHRARAFSGRRGEVARMARALLEATGAAGADRSSPPDAAPGEGR